MLKSVREVVFNQHINRKETDDILFYHIRGTKFRAASFAIMCLDDILQQTVAKTFIDPFDEKIHVQVVDQIWLECVSDIDLRLSVQQISRMSARIKSITDSIKQ